MHFYTRNAIFAEAPGERSEPPLAFSSSSSRHTPTTLAHWRQRRRKFFASPPRQRRHHRAQPGVPARQRLASEASPEAQKRAKRAPVTTPSRRLRRPHTDAESANVACQNASDVPRERLYGAHHTTRKQQVGEQVGGNEAMSAAAVGRRHRSSLQRSGLHGVCVRRKEFHVIGAESREHVLCEA